MERNSVRFLGVALALLMVSGAAAAGAEMISVENFEFYTDTDDLRLSWQVEMLGGMMLTIDLESDTGGKGSAWDGHKYMRVNFLYATSELVYSMGGVDWRNYQSLHVWYRGISPMVNDQISMQVKLVGARGNHFGIEQLDVSTGAEWQEHVVDLSGWDSIDEAQEVRLCFLSGFGSAEFYIDGIGLMMAPVATGQETWGGVKALYH